MILHQLHCQPSTNTVHLQPPLSPMQGKTTNHNHRLLDRKTHTYDGTGNANSSTKSTGPSAHPLCRSRSSRSWTVLSMYGCIDATCSGVNQPATMLRYRMWSGASMSTKVGRCFAACLPPSLNSGKPGLRRSCWKGRGTGPDQGQCWSRR